MNTKLLPIYLLTLVNSIGFSLLIPIYPFLVEKYNENEIVYGALIALYSFSQFLGAPLMGALSDKYGRRSILLLSQTGTLISWFIFAFSFLFSPDIRFVVSLPIWIVIFSRIVDGVTGGNVSVTYAYVSDTANRSEKTKIFGTIAGLSGLGFMIGPWIGGVTSVMPWGYFTTIIFAAAFSLVTLLFIQFLLPESLPKEKRHEHPLSIKKEINIIKKFLAYRGNKVIKRAFAIKIFWTFAFTAFTTCFGLYAKDILGLSALEIGNLFPIIGIFSVFNQFIIVKKCVPKVGDVKAFRYSLLIMGLSLISLSLNPNYTLLLIIIYFITLGYSILITTTKSLVTDAVHEQKQGEISGLDEAILSVNMSIAPIFAAVLYIGYGSSTSFFIFGIIVLIPALFVLIKKPILKYNHAPA